MDYLSHFCGMSPPDTGFSVAPAVSRVFAIVCCAWFFVSGCRKDPSLYRVHNLNGGVVAVLGHGGMGRKSALPMNSEASLLQCTAAGADGVETDVRMSADGELILFHDARLEHATTCDGAVEQTDAGNMISCKYRKNGRRHALYTLRDLLGSLQQDRWLTLDCKTTGDRKRDSVFAGRVAWLLSEHQRAAPVLVESPHPAFLHTIKHAAPAVQVYFYTQAADTAIAVATRSGFDGITMHIDRISPAAISKAHQAGLRVSLFGMTTPIGSI